MNKLGTIVHETLKEIYNESINIKLDNKFINNSIKAFIPILLKNFEIYYPNGDITKGKNLIISKVAEQMILNTLNSDKSFFSKGIEIIPLNNEIEFETELVQKENKYKIYGIFDRLDKFNGRTRIIDYKTGKLYSLSLLKKGQNYENFSVEDLNSQQFQLLFYLLLYMESKKDINEIPEVGILSLKQSSVEFNKLIYSDKDKEIPKEIIVLFRNYIIELIKEINNLDIPFYRTNNVENCKYCEYQSICNYFKPIIENIDE